MRVIAVDWSGRRVGAAEFIWLAEVRDGLLTTLENGRDRDAVVDHLIATSQNNPETVIGLDFAFSFPAWWCAQQDWHSATEIWTAVAKDGEELLAACEPPLWGRPGKPNPNPRELAYRRTDREDGPGAKSVFQIGGSGAVGTGSIRGIPQLLRLQQAGFDIWPFGPGGLPRVLEIYPRALTGPVVKSREAHRRRYLASQLDSQPPELLERAAGSEDAFDAAVSALKMWNHRNELLKLTPTPDPVLAIEGRIWVPLLQQ
jgi:hypothetical protein